MKHIVFNEFHRFGYFATVLIFFGKVTKEKCFLDSILEKMHNIKFYID